jgi:hypothetical protein
MRRWFDRSENEGLLVAKAPSLLVSLSTLNGRLTTICGIPGLSH